MPRYQQEYELTALPSNHRIRKHTMAYADGNLCHVLGQAQICGGLTLYN